MKVRNFKELRAKLESTPGRAERMKRLRAETLDEILHYRLGEIRKMREQTQIELAEAIGVTQPSVAKVERSEDPQLSTLRKYIEGLGGHLEVTAVFDGERFPLEI